MPRNAVVSVGCLWGRSGSRTCGILVGTPKFFGGSRSWSFRDLETGDFCLGRFAAKPALLASS